MTLRLPSAEPVRIGQVFHSEHAAGRLISRVLRLHSSPGFWEALIVGGDHPALVGSVQVVSDEAIRGASARFRPAAGYSTSHRDLGSFAASVVVDLAALASLAGVVTLGAVAFGA